jgi:hypothetical protein
MAPGTVSGKYGLRVNFLNLWRLIRGILLLDLCGFLCRYLFLDFFFWGNLINRRGLWSSTTSQNENEKNDQKGF